MQQARRVALLLTSLPAALAQQVIITVGIPYCSTNSNPFSYGSMTASSTRTLPSSSATATSPSSPVLSSYGGSLSTVLSSSIGAQSSIPQSSGLQTSNALPYTDASSTPLTSTAASSSSSNAPFPSASTYVDIFGEVYSVQSDTGLSGNTIDPAPVYGSGIKRRQDAVSSEQVFEECVANCSLTPACVAAAVMGTTCQLYSSVSGTMGLSGGQVAFNEERFQGFTDEPPPNTSGFPTSYIGVSTFPSSAAATSSSGVATSSSNSDTIVPPSATGATSAVMSSSAASTESAVQHTTTTLSASGTPSWWSSAPPSTVYTSFFTPGPSTNIQIPSSLAPESSTLTSTSSSALGSSVPVTPSVATSPVASLSVVSSVAIDTTPAMPTSSIDTASSSIAFSSGFDSSSADVSTVIVTPVRSSDAIPPSSSTPEQFSSASASSDISSSVLLPSSSLAESPSTTSLVASTPTWRPSIMCPEQNGTTVTDVDGIQYYLVCESDTGGDTLGLAGAAVSFNDCFDFCDAAGACTGFTYAGAENGEGSGNCYLKQGTLYFVASDAFHIAAIRMSPFVSPTPSNTPASSSSPEVQSSTTVATISNSAITSSVMSMSNSETISSSVIMSTTSTPPASPSSSSALGSRSIVSASMASLSSLASSWSSSSSSAAATSSLSSALSSSSSSRVATLHSTSTTRTTTTSTTTSFTTTTTTTTSSSSSSSLSSSTSTFSVVSGPTPVVNDGKRGLAYTNASLTLPYSLSGQNSRVSWGYNWYNQRYTDTANTSNPAIRFIPLLFNDDPQLTSQWPSRAQAAINDGADALMSFNEPNLCGDGTGAACMSIQRCVTAYQKYMMPFNNTPGVKLGAPAVTDNGGLDWLRDFMGNCTGCHYDFINLHWYSNAYAFSYLQYYVRLAWQTFGMPIWITEFGMTGESYNTDMATQNFLKNATAFLDAVPYVERYSWFYNAPGYLINANGKGLSAQGVIYNAYTAPCPAWATGDGSCY